MSTSLGAGAERRIGAESTTALTPFGHAQIVLFGIPITSNGSGL